MRFRTVVKVTDGWSGLLGQKTGICKWEIVLGYGSCRSLFLRLCA